VYTRQIVKKLGDAGITLHGMPWTKDTLHAAFQNAFLIECEFEFNGLDQKVYESTANMGKKRFAEYIDEQIKPFVYELWNIHIDEPSHDDEFWREVLREIKR